MSTLQRGATLTAVAVLLAGAVVGCNQRGGSGGGTSSSGINSDATVATVNGTPITQAQFYEQLQTYRPQSNPMSGMDPTPAGIAVLRSMIQMQLIEQLAKKDNVYPTDAQVDQQFQDMELQASRTSVKSFDDQLAQSGLTADFFKQNQIVPQLCQYGELTKGLTVTDAEIKAYYDMHKNDMFTDPDQAHIKRIQTATQSDAQAVYDQLQKGASWDTEFNSPQSTDKSIPGGDVPQWINMATPGAQIKPLMDAIKATAPGKYAPPFKFGAGYWVIQVVEKRPKQTFPLDKVQDLIRQQILQQDVQKDPTRFGAFQSAMRDKATTADIKIDPQYPQYQPLVQQITNPAPAPQMSAPPPGAGAPPAGRPTPPAGAVTIKPGPPSASH